MKSLPARLVLEDGTIYEGYSFGANNSSYGEVVFATSMTGYQEMLTDPSFAGQIVVPTYPIIGNYGINDRDSESKKIQVSGFVVREFSRRPSHSLSTSSLDNFLKSHDVPGISGVDTRAITRHLRSRGVMMGMITTQQSGDEALEELTQLPRYEETDFVSKVSTRHAYPWDLPTATMSNEFGSYNPAPETTYKITVTDCGLKYNILRILRSKGCQVTVLPATAQASDILDTKPDGVLISPGPGDPNNLNYAVNSVKELAGKVPLFGICLGNQVVGKAFGGTTFKLKFGHRGANHSVRDIETGAVYITAQNHGYALDPDSLPSDIQVSHINLNDDTVEGIKHKSLPILTIQYHSEASPGPQDNEYLFDRFLDLVKEYKS